MYGPVVVGVDGTAEALRAVRWAAAHAGLHGTDLRLVYATGAVSAGELLVRESAGATLVVLGRRGHGGYFGTLVGTTARTVAARGQCPMSVMGTGEPGHGPVVVGDDGTAVSDAALDFAFHEAALRGAELVAVHGLVTPAVGGVPLDGDHAEEVLAERLEGRAARCPEVKAACRVVADTPGRALLDEAEAAQLVVVGSGRRVGYRGALLRSTSQHLLHHAPCPVAVVRRDHVV